MSSLALYRNQPSIVHTHVVRDGLPFRPSRAPNYAPVVLGEYPSLVPFPFQTANCESRRFCTEDPPLSSMRSEADPHEMPIHPPCQERKRTEDVPLAGNADHRLRLQSIRTAPPTVPRDLSPHTNELLSTPIQVAQSAQASHAEATLPMQLSPDVLSRMSPYPSKHAQAIPETAVVVPTLPRHLDPSLPFKFTGACDGSMPLSTASLPTARAVSRNPSSMSLRRLASNRPVLQCKVDLPPLPSFPSGSLSGNTLTSAAFITPGKMISPLPLSLRQFSLAFSKTRTASASPVTPVDQIMPTTPLSPPRLEDTSLSMSKTKARKLPIGASFRPAVYDDLAPKLPLRSPVLGLGLDIAGTPNDITGNPLISKFGLPSPLLLDGPSSAKPSPLVTSFPLFPAPAPAAATVCNTPDQDVLSPKKSKALPATTGSCPGPVTSQAFLRARARPPLRLSLPRRLSYNRPGFVCSSRCGTPTPGKADKELASPAIIGTQSGSARLQSYLTQNANTRGTPSLQAHLPGMVESESYFWIT